MSLKRPIEEAQSIPDYAKQFVDDVNDNRLKNGELPLNEEELKDLIDKLKNVRQGY